MNKRTIKRIASWGSLAIVIIMIVLFQLLGTTTSDNRTATTLVTTSKTAVATTTASASTKQPDGVSEQLVASYIDTVYRVDKELAVQQRLDVLTKLVDSSYLPEVRKNLETRTEAAKRLGTPKLGVAVVSPIGFTDEGDSPNVTVTIVNFSLVEDGTPISSESHRVQWRKTSSGWVVTNDELLT